MVKKQDRLEVSLNPSRYSFHYPMGVNGLSTHTDEQFSPFTCLLKNLVSSCLVLEFA